MFNKTSIINFTVTTADRYYLDQYVFGMVNLWNEVISIYREMYPSTDDDIEENRNSDYEHIRNLLLHTLIPSSEEMIDVVVSYFFKNMYNKHDLLYIDAVNFRYVLSTMNHILKWDSVDISVDQLSNIITVPIGAVKIQLLFSEDIDIPVKSNIISLKLISDTEIELTAKYHTPAEFAIAACRLILSK